jgi:hypothetical protein
MPDTFIAQQNRLRQRRRQKNLDIANGSVFQGVITGDHDINEEKVGVAYYAGQRKLPTLHPYLGSDSWIRTGAEGGQPVLAAQRPDSAAPELLAYAPKEQDVRTETYKSGVGLYRPINPGEIEIHSKGTAQTFYSQRPLLEQRGGLIRNWLDQDNLESGSRSPIHVRHLHLKRSGEVGDEERFGVVSRPDGSSRIARKYVRADRVIDPILGAGFVASAVTAGVVAEPGPWAKEYTRVIRSGAIFPEKLVDHREGDVIDDAGDPVNLTSSGKPLRMKAEYFADSLFGGVFFVGIDQDGNFSVAAPDEASVGGDVTIPAGDLLVTIGASHTVQVQTDYSLATAAGTMTLDAQTGFALTVNDGSITFAPSNTLDVGGADEPAVLGNQLLDFLGQFLDLFSQHLHTGNMGAPTPLDPAVITQVTQLKAQFVDQAALISDYINFSKLP